MKPRIFLVDGLISRLIAQTCRQSGLSVVYAELFSFEGAAIHFHEAASLVGSTYGKALFRFPNATLIGLRYADGRVQVSPPMATAIQPGDQVIAIATGGAALHPPAATDYDIDPAAIATDSPRAALERLLILGWNRAFDSFGVCHCVAVGA